MVKKNSHVDLLQMSDLMADLLFANKPIWECFVCHYLDDFWALFDTLMVRSGDIIS